eukprot:10929630-Alexandrium_andersonii.AAC.1
MHFQSTVLQADGCGRSFGAGGSALACSSTCVRVSSNIQPRVLARTIQTQLLQEPCKLFATDRAD